jgi:predicted NACHT family NTPase
MEPITGVVFSPDGKTLVSRSQDQTLRLWAVSTGKEIRQVKEDRWCRAVALSPDGRTLACGALWKIGLTDEIHLDKISGPTVRCLGFSPDSQILAAGCDDQTIRLWDARNGKEIRRFATTPDWTYSLTFSPDGKSLAVGGYDSLRLIEIATGKELQEFKGHRGWVFSVMFLIEGNLLLSAGADRTIRLWQVATGKQKGQFRGHEGKVYSIALAPDGKTLAAGGSDKTVRLWEVVSFSEIRQFRGHQGEVSAVSYCSDGKKVASGSEDKTALIWDITRYGNADADEAKPEAFERLWADLASEDAAKAHRAIWIIAAGAKQTIPVLKRELRPDQGRIPKLIADLDSEKFATREQATEELVRLGGAAEPALQKALENKPSLEVTRRIEEILEKVKRPDSSSEWWRSLRALQAIEYAETPEAQQLLESLASGHPDSLLTQEARASLGRVRKRLAAKP